MANQKLMFPRALEIATEAHKEQFRKKSARRNSGTPESYIEHPKRVADGFQHDDFCQTVAILHDVLEDHPHFELIVKKEFPKRVFDGVKTLSKKKEENYFDFIMRIIKSNDLDLMLIKLRDIGDNSRDIEEGAKKDKYRFATYLLLSKIYDITHDH